MFSKDNNKTHINNHIPSQRNKKKYIKNTQAFCKNHFNYYMAATAAVLIIHFIEIRQCLSVFRNFHASVFLFSFSLCMLRTCYTAMKYG